MVIDPDARIVLFPTAASPLTEADSDEAVVLEKDGETVRVTVRNICRFDFDQAVVEPTFAVTLADPEPKDPDQETVTASLLTRYWVHSQIRAVTVTDDVDADTVDGDWTISTPMRAA
ncbi:hypothetical protein [Micrococcus lylae]|uniref:hypothetical protein n=1 Tax=Micrococcus lylae TaxID=1273 RepID=UPI000C7FB386|nr:hypothetical protein [Micrococcus lylae]WIK82171.1 hypothetical protein CJ228_011385 [Micrococcus lylae]